MPRYSIVVPVYNRPDEIEELLECLVSQSFKDFEILVIEDGSSLPCDYVVERFKNLLNIQYYFKENSGQGFSRNYGFERSSGDWLIVFDSDCLIPENYFEIVNRYIEEHEIDAYGGPDKAHSSFTPVQKAISYSMTSFFTTGGIRGNKKHLGKFHPRSFNMGISKQVFEKTGGYILPRKGEDIEFSIRITENGFKTALIEDAFVYHKRRTSFRQFFKQLHFFGTARINVFRFYPKELKVVHLFPSVFLTGLLTSVILAVLNIDIGLTGLLLYALYFALILGDATVKNRSLKIGVLSIVAAFIQLSAYGLGFLKESAIYLAKG